MGLNTPPRPSGRRLWVSTPLPDRRDDDFRPQHPSPTVGTTTSGLITSLRPSGRRLWASIDSTRPRVSGFARAAHVPCRTAPAGSTGSSHSRFVLASARFSVRNPAQNLMKFLPGPAHRLHFLAFLCIALSAFVPKTARGQIAPGGSIYVQQPTGVHYIFGSGGTKSGGGFFYVNYLTSEFDVIGPVTVSSTGSFSGVSGITGRSISGQISSTTISLTYNGATIASTKQSLYGPSAAFAGNYVGTITEPTLGVFSANLVNFSNGVSLLVALGSSVTFGVGSIDSGGHASIKTLAGETISTTFAPVNGTARGTASSSFGYNYTYGATKAIPPRLANISTRGFVGAGEQVLIGGFIVHDGGKTVLINAKGPSLAAQGVANPVSNPKVDLYFNGQIIASNGNWRTNTNVSELTASGLAPTNDMEASLQVSLEPGTYTAIVSSEDGSQGIGLIEVYGIE